MYCSGSIDYITKKFVHDKRCQLYIPTTTTANPQPNTKVSSGNISSNATSGIGQQANLTNQRKTANKGVAGGANSGGSNYNNNLQTNHSEVSTQGSNSVSRAAVSMDAEFSQDEERDIQEFARKLEII